MSRCWSDVDGRHYVDDEVEDQLPVVDARWIGKPYTAGMIDYETYVHQTVCNRRVTQQTGMCLHMDISSELFFTLIAG